MPTNTHIKTLISCLHNKQLDHLNRCYPKAHRSELPCIIKPKCTEIVSIVKHCGLKRLLAYLATHTYTAVLSFQKGDAHYLFPLGYGVKENSIGKFREKLENMFTGTSMCRLRNRTCRQTDCIHTDRLCA